MRIYHDSRGDLGSPRELATLMSTYNSLRYAEKANFISSYQPFNHSTIQPFNHSTIQPFNLSTFQSLNQKTYLCHHMKKYKHIFIDLDRTLWDFEKSAREVFAEIYENFELKDRGIPSNESFTSTYKKINDLLWSYYRKGEIKKEVLSVKRFAMTLNEYRIDDEVLGAQIGDYYVTHSPRKVNLFPYTHEILEYLNPKYQLHIITNGFEEVQQTKLDLGNLRQYFTQIITSEEAGVKKPEKGIFEYAFHRTGAHPEESMMIGDDLAVDIDGAKAVGMDHIFVNHYHEPHNDEVSFEVFSLKEIEGIL